MYAQLEKAYAPTLTLLYNIISSIAVPANAFSPIIFTDSGISILGNDEQPANEFAPITFNVNGNSTDDNEVHPENVPSRTASMLVAAARLTVSTCVFANAPTDNVVSALAVTTRTSALNAPGEIAPLIVTDGAV